jgi:hypothetical protein
MHYAGTKKKWKIKDGEVATREIVIFQVLLKKYNPQVEFADHRLIDIVLTNQKSSDPVVNFQLIYFEYQISVTFRGDL